MKLVLTRGERPIPVYTEHGSVGSTIVITI